MKIRVNVVLNAPEGYSEGECVLCPLCIINHTGDSPYSYNTSYDCAIGFSPKSCPVEIEEGK